MAGPPDPQGLGLPDGSVDPRLLAVRECLRLADEDRRRGVQYWFDPQLAGDLRELVREAAALDAPRPGPAKRAPAPPSTPSAPVSAPTPPAPPPPAPPPAGLAPSGVPAEPPHEPAEASAGPARDFRRVVWSLPVAGGEQRGRRGPGSGSSPEAGSSAVPRPVARPQWGPPPKAKGRQADWEARLGAVAAEASGCLACGLCQTRRNVVFGVGSGDVPLVFVGEAPGADEDAQGIPFVGRAGQLLTKIIEAMGLKREDVYICNVLKCRPPENRNPAPDEIAACSRFLERQLEILKPKVICTLGLFASQILLQTTVPIGKLRGRWFEYRGIRLLPTYHPAALLRNPNLKATVWEDVQLVRKALES